MQNVHDEHHHPRNYAPSPFFVAAMTCIGVSLFALGLAYWLAHRGLS